ncbi:class I SAM-dependent methyltransferase [Streptomyces sp. SID13031]|uniref:class I SAM-dependent methyltransferase n=1 Tax=Streptomyces sp. SID13031 TaxID=2706046 RepID=UPI001EF20634|nr:class I SAM-dependent methyltransferase [Streptomyces sp. SID13031]
MARGNGAIEKHVVKMARLQGKEHVMVLGPGPGVGLVAAAERAAIVVGVDPSDTMLLAARHHCGELVEAGKVQLIRGDAADTHQPDHSASVVISVNNVQLWADRPAAYAEIRRVMKPAARLLVSVSEKRAPGNLLAELESAGFSNVKVSTWDPPGRRTTAAAIYTADR